METIEILILMACLSLPIWMGDVLDYAEDAEELIELIRKEEEEIMKCIHDNGLM
jgi:hypothetical protein